MKKIFLAMLLACSCCSMAWAQMPCGNNQLEQQLQRSNAHYLQQKDKEKKDWGTFNSAMSLSKMIISGKDTSYEIPVVVHIMHTGDVIGSIYNPTNTAVDSMIDYLNKTWAASWPKYADTLSGGTKMPIKFVLAKRGPDCNTTTGITRTDASALSGYTSYGICPFATAAGPSDAAVKQMSIWPSRDYFNIWLVNKIENGTVGGYAPWPWYIDADLLDGVVTCAEYAKPLASISDYFYTPAHEIGHSFGLYHTFQDGCDATGSCTTEGDEICDTEPHNYVAMTCDAGKINDCTGVLFNGVEHNFMNYTTCPQNFTKGQRTRVKFTLWNYRMGLVNSLGATPPDPSFSTPTVACKPNINNVVNSYNMGPCNVQFANMITSSSGYNTDGSSYIDRTCIQQSATVTQGLSYPISISTTSGIQNVRAWIDYNNDGVFQTTELVFSNNGLLDDETHSGMVRIPTTGVTTKTNLRMRIMSDYTISSPSPCTNVEYGQTEDYTLIVNPGTTSINEKEIAFPFRLYPNPSAGLVQVIASEPVDCQIYSIDGKLLMQEKNKTELDISALTEGIYLIYAYRKSDGSLLGIQKIVKSLSDK